MAITARYFIPAFVIVYGIDFSTAFLVHLAFGTLIHADGQIWQKVSLLIQSLLILLLSHSMFWAWGTTREGRGRENTVHAVLAIRGLSLA